MKTNYRRAVLGIASVVLVLGALGTANAKDTWILLGEKAIKSTDPSTEIRAEEGKTWKEDVKRAKLSVEGADVQITKIVLNWDNRPDKTLTDVGTLKAGGQTAATYAPGRKGRLTWVKIQYKILGDKKTATVKILGYD